jgi:hypothetical protein
MNRPEGDEGAIVSEAEQAIDEQFGAKIRACKRLYDCAKGLPLHYLFGAMPVGGNN